ncbi:MAG: sulfatase [Opitutaceae bacterium]|nr:sulfatase [Opitutaceae bacterium]
MNSSAVIIATLLLVASAASAAAPSRWNVLYLISDDLNNNLGCYGNPVVKSPNIDRLAARGMRFDRAYCSYPVCNASRTSFLSGRRPDTTGVVDNQTPTRAHLREAVFMPELFRQQGYRTIKVGKIFHTGAEFEDPRSWDVDIRETSRAKNPPVEQILRRQGPDGIVLRAKDEDTWEGFVARKAVELLTEAAAGNAPFFVAAGFRMPHRPYIAPEKYYALYDPDELKPRAGPREHLAKVPDLALTYRTGINPGFPAERPGDTIAAYYAAISYMDAQVGVVLQALDQLGLWDRTIVVFQSDHGYHLGEHGGLWHKLSLFEECARIPLIVAAPGRKTGASLRLVESVDLFPTLANLCGLPVREALEGTSFVPLLDDPVQPWKRAAFTVVARPRRDGDGKFGDLSWLGRTAFDGRWRYTEWPDGGAELYDHHHDPFEYENLAAEPEQRTQLARMKKILGDGWRGARPGM